jgi:hypothetical protein
MAWRWAEMAGDYRSLDLLVISSNGMETWIISSVGRYDGFDVGELVHKMEVSNKGRVANMNPA